MTYHIIGYYIASRVIVTSLVAVCLQVSTQKDYNVNTGWGGITGSRDYSVLKNVDSIS